MYVGDIAMVVIYVFMIYMFLYRHIFAGTRPKDEPLNAIMDAFWALGEEERAVCPLYALG